LINRTILAEEEPDSIRLRQEAEALMQELALLTKTQGTALAETKQLKSEYEVLRAQVKEVDGKKQALQQTNTKLKSRLIESPEQFKRNLADLANKLQKEQQNRSETERKRAEVDKRLLEIRKINKMLHKCIKLLEELAVEQDKVKEEKRKVKEEKAAIQVADDALREVRVNKQAAARQISSLKDTKLQRLNENHEQRRKRLVDLQEKARVEKQAIDKDADVMATRIDQIQLEIQKLQNEQQIASRDHEDNLSTLQQRLSELFGQITVYQRTLTSKMEAVASENMSVPVLPVV
jgi:kinetochore protein Nuf2